MTRESTKQYRNLPEYYIWKSMRQRCRDPKVWNYERYGGRGISVCERWNSFLNFLSDVGYRPSSLHQLDRIDNNGNYEPGNVRWATIKEQTRNRRSNHLLTINGVTKPLVEWAEIKGFQWHVIKNRIRKGWPQERLLEPLGPQWKSHRA